MSATTVTPNADRALLAAQASAGTAGVEAYEAAKRELSAQQAAAVAQAQAEAQRRGSPTGALSAASGGAADMYDRRIASLTEAQGIAGAQAAARQGRMADYSSSVNQARGLIADQAAQTVAPINAETDFRVRSMERQGLNDLSRLEREGQNAVDQINAQMRLDAARAAAAGAARGGGGGGGRGGGGGGGGGGGDKGKLNDTDLRSQMANRSTTKMAKTIGAAQQAMRQTAEQQRQAVSYAGRSAQEFGLKNQKPTKRVSLAQQEANRQAVAFTGRSVTAPQQKAAPAWQQSVARRALDTVVRQQSEGLGIPQMQRDVQQRASNTARSIAPLYSDDRASMFTPQQMEQFAQSPDAPLFSFLMPDDEGRGAVRRIRGVDEVLGGAPQFADQGAFKLGDLAQGLDGRMTRFNPRDGEVDERSRAAMRDAMMLSAFDMQDEGYDITDPEITTALDDDATWKIGSTYADVIGRGRGIGDMADQQTRADAANERDRRLMSDAERDELDATTDMEMQGFTQATGLDAKKYSQWRPDQLVEMVADPNFNAAVEAVSGARNRDEAVRILTEAGLSPSDPYDRTIIEIVADMMNV